MATAPVLDLEPASTDIVVPSADLIVAEPKRGDVVLFNRDAFDQFEAKLRDDLKDFTPDLSTVAGRKAIASKAFEVTKVKTTLERQAKTLTEEWRTKTKAVNDGRNVIVARLEALADEVRAPLTVWEEAEKARVDRCKEIIADIHGAAIVTMDDTSETVRERGMRIWAVEIGEEFGDMGTEAEQAKSATISTLQAALNRLKKEEADAAELAKLRAENEARIAREAEEQAERDRKAAQIEAERIAEERRVADEKAAEEHAKRIAEESAEAERKRIQLQHEAELAEIARAAEKERNRITLGRQMLAYIREVVAGRIGGEVQPFGVLLRELESKVVADESYGDMRAEIEQARVDGLASLNAAMERQAERRRIEEEREAEQVKLQEERERAENKANRARVKTAAKQAIMTCGVSEDAAQKVVLAIIAGEVPAVSLRF